MEKNSILIIGLGQIGTSIGLALQAHSDRLNRIGLTRDVGKANHAKKIGAVDKTMLNLPSATRKADIVVLAVPMDQVEETLELISKDMKAGTVVLDTSPARAQAAEWALKHFNDEQYYVGFTPILNPRSLLSVIGGIDEASDLLFQDGMFAITSPEKTGSDALKLASDMATLLRATPMFADTEEVDSYLAAVHVLPQLMAAGMSRMMADSPGWGELRKFAGRPFAQVTQVLENMDDAPALSSAAQSNKENVLRMLDGLISELGAMREELDADSAGQFEGRIEGSTKARKAWWQERQLSEWLNERGADADFSAVDVGGMGQLFTGKPGGLKRGRE